MIRDNVKYVISLLPYDKIYYRYNMIYMNVYLKTC